MLNKDCYSQDDYDLQLVCIHHISAKNVLPDDPYNILAIEKILNDYGFSYNELLLPNGTFKQLIPEGRKSFHAGKSTWQGIDWINGISHSIAWVATGDKDYTDYQYIAMARRFCELEAKHGELLGLEDHRTVRDAFIKKNDGMYNGNKIKRKYDMDSSFNWNRLMLAIDIQKNKGF